MDGTDKTQDTLPSFLVQPPQTPATLTQRKLCLLQRWKRRPQRLEGQSTYSKIRVLFWSVESKYEFAKQKAQYLLFNMRKVGYDIRTTTGALRTLF